MGIHDKAGEKMLEAVSKLRNINEGIPYVTKGFGLKAFEVFHINPPKGLADKQFFAAEHSTTLNRLKRNLANCYERCLQKALDHNHVSIAFPYMSSDKDGWPVHVVVKIAVDTVKKFRKDTGSRVLVIFCCRN